MIGRTNASNAAITTGVPLFDYTGDYLILDDGDDNWRIKFLTSGTLAFQKLNGAAKGIDVFLVGGGGGGLDWNTNYASSGGGGGYTTTNLAYVSVNTPYDIVVGAGGAIDHAGSSSTAFGVSAAGGKSLYTAGRAAGDGGSGGGYSSRNGGSDGSDGDGGSAGKSGIGQHTTTREFGEATGDLYSGGGGGGKWGAAGGLGGAGGGGDSNQVSQGYATAGAANTGGGGGGGGAGGKSAAGGSGIVIIRNHREVSA